MMAYTKGSGTREGFLEMDWDLVSTPGLDRVRVCSRVGFQLICSTPNTLMKVLGMPRSVNTLLTRRTTINCTSV